MAEIAEVRSLLFDPILTSFVEEEFTDLAETKKKTDLICSHCYQPILGKVYRIEDHYFDEYCFSLRYSLGYEVPKRREHEPKKG